MYQRIIMVSMGVIILLMTGCSSMVLRQDIPVSTNPMGAKIYADGQLVGTTPGTVSLERTKDHILTLVREDYRQEDVVITRQYQRDRVLMKAVQAGVDTGLFFNDTRMGIQRGFGSMYGQENTGEAYILVPAAVTVGLTPLSGVGARTPAGGTGSMKEERIGDRGKTPEVAEQEQGTLVKDLLRAGAVGGAAAMKPVEKRWDTSSSSRTYVQPDGTQVRKESRTSVGVGINPAGLVDVIDKLFR